MFDLEMFVVFISLVNESFVFSKKKKNKACVCVRMRCGAYGGLGCNPQRGLALVGLLVPHRVCV